MLYFVVENIWEEFTMKIEKENVSHFKKFIDGFILSMWL
jgi:hypothetical protein